MKWTRTLCACVCVVLFVVGLGLAQDAGFVPPQPASRIIYVDQCCVCEDGDGLSPDRPLATIQAGVDLARHRDRVFVAAGTYEESLDLKGKAITVKGIAGPLGVPILKATGQPAVQMLSGEDSRTVLQNMVICDSLVGISLVDSHPTLQNLTVVKCGIGVLGLGESDPKINNCILWDNSLEDLAGVTAYYCDIERLSDSSRLYNLNVDPLFMDSKNNDYRLRTRQGRYEWAIDQWLYDEQTSPCVNGGDPAMDYSQEPYPNGERTNMGAFGNTVYASMGPDLSVGISSIRWGFSTNSSASGWSMSASAEVTTLDRQIARVEFYLDEVLVAQDGSARDGWAAEWPMEFDEDLYEFELVVVAVDTEGVRSLSEPEVVEIDTRPSRGHGGGR
ncbi:MAG: hypothetical protein HQ515_18175 [Phycisphaeraceae bacterium]|nr:hypothetical protein [Phycisphaeraceae bacterium]